MDFDIIILTHIKILYTSSHLCNTSTHCAVQTQGREGGGGQRGDGERKRGEKRVREKGGGRGGDGGGGGG